MAEIELGNEEVHSTSLSAKFYTHFQTKKNDITLRLEALQERDSTSDTPSPEYALISTEISTLRKDLITATSYLPTYDQGKCEQQLKVLEEFLSRHRSPKSKFVFKRKPTTSSSHPPQNSEASLKPTPALPDEHSPGASMNIILSNRSAAHLTLSSFDRLVDASSSHPVDLQRGSDVTITDVCDCIVNLLPPETPPDVTRPMLTITALHAKTLRRVVLLIPPIEGSVLLHDVNNAIVVTGCHQFRIHDSTNTTILLYTFSNPIIERSQNIRFGPYPAALHRLFPRSFLERASCHKMVQDFDWIKSSPSPNWRMLESSQSLEERLAQLSDVGVEDNEVEMILKQVLND